MTGYAAVYSFPFRIYYVGVLETMREELNDGGAVQVYPPFLNRQPGTPLVSPPPRDSCPGFEWAPEVQPSEHVDPVDMQAQPEGWKASDCLRVDVWGTNADLQVDNFVHYLLLWLRHCSRQSWITDIELIADISHTFHFEIDSTGRALKSPITTGRIQMPASRPIDSDLWSSSIHRVIQEETPPLYWQIFLDAVQFRCKSRIREAVLFLSSSLEMCRDSMFPEVDFESNDLSKHLNLTLRAVTGTGISDYSPDLYSRIKELYIARGHVAHGKKPVYPSASGMQPVTFDVIESWEKNVIDTLTWLETMAGNERVEELLHADEALLAANPRSGTPVRAAAFRSPSPL
jgi:hypothetical protein